MAVVTRNSAVALVAVAVAAAVVTWVAVPTLRKPDEQADRGERSEVPAKGLRTPSTVDESAPPRDREVPVVEANGEPAAATVPIDTAVPSRKPTPLSLDAPPLTDAAGSIDPTVTLAGTKLPPIKASDPDVARSLLSSTRLYCQFGDGVGGVANSDTFKLAPGNATQAAGPTTLEVLDLSAGRAQMTGDAGAASSSTGVSPMRVTPTENALTFSGISPLGEIILTTVFATKSPTGRFTAVQSRHGLREPHIGAQFYGSCEGDGQR
jgi:hypothetical protein